MNKTEYFCDIMSAYLKGKTIQYQNENGEWIDCNGEDWDFGKNYRIKKEIEPFESAHECFEEMQKHPEILNKEERELLTNILKEGNSRAFLMRREDYSMQVALNNQMYKVSDTKEIRGVKIFKLENFYIRIR